MRKADQLPNPDEVSKFFVDDPRKITWENQDAAIRSSQVIVVALAVGLGIYASVASTQVGLRFNAQLGQLTWIGIALACSMIPLSFVVPQVIGATQSGGLNTGQGEPESHYLKLFERFQTQLIVGCAMLEGAGFLNIYAYQSERNPIALGLTGLCVLLMLARFPTKSRVQNWIARKL